MATKNTKSPTYQFKPLEEDMIEQEAELLLVEIINDWDKMCKRFQLKGKEDNRDILLCQFYAQSIVKKFPALKIKYLFYHYDDALSDFLGVKYVIKPDKRSQSELGYKSLFHEGNYHYLFSIEK